MDQGKNKTTLTKIASTVGTIIGIAGVVFVARTLISQREEVSNAFSQLQAFTLLVSFLLALCAMTWIGFLWTRMLEVRGHHARPQKAMAWYFTGQLGKYVPGGIWPIVGRAEMATRAGVARGDAYAATGLSMVTTYAAAVLAICFGSIFSWSYPAVGVLGLTGFSLFFLAFSNQRLRHKILSLLNRVSPRATSLTEPRRLFVLIVAHLPAWILMSLSTSMTATAFGADIGIFHMLFLTAASWFAGFVVIGVPGGIGVRESIFTALAGSAMSPGAAISIALASRVIFIAVDVSGAVIASLIAKVSLLLKS